MRIGNLQKILLHDIHNLLCDLILKHESTSPEFVWGFQCSLLGSKIHYLGKEKSNSLHGSTQVVNVHYLGQIHNLGQNIIIHVFSKLVLDIRTRLVVTVKHETKWMPNSDSALKLVPKCKILCQYDLLNYFYSYLKIAVF